MLKRDKGVKLPKFSIGDIVRVRPKETISQNLDSFIRLEGCLFMEQMWQYCGQTFNIIQTVNHFFDEHRFKMYRPKANFYLLDGLICSGDAKSLGQRCDRSCYLFWHEDWLENI